MRQDPEKVAGTEQYAAFVIRLIRAVSRRTETVSVDSLAQFAQIRAELDAQELALVRTLRSEAGGAHSWAEIGAALGIGRAGAFKRYGSDPGDARTRGGQPAQLR